MSGLPPEACVLRIPQVGLDVIGIAAGQGEPVHEKIRSQRVNLAPDRGEVVAQLAALDGADW
jgi:hypothetical protein